MVHKHSNVHTQGFTVFSLLRKSALLTELKQLVCARPRGHTHHNARSVIFNMFKHRDSTNHGIDISKSRLDDVDREVVAFALGYKGKKVAVDLGCGSGRVSIILALMGFDVWLYDIQDLSDYFTKVGEVLEIGDKLHFIQTDIALLVVSHNISGGEDEVDEGSERQTQYALPSDIVIAISQRTLHHLLYVSARDLLQGVNHKMIKGGKLFLSVSGIESKLAEDYECADSPAAERFCPVGEVGKSVYSISGNVCLYKQQEVVDMLEGVGLTVDKVYKSAFGNIKAICSKKA